MSNYYYLVNVDLYGFVNPAKCFVEPLAYVTFLDESPSMSFIIKSDEPLKDADFEALVPDISDFKRVTYSKLSNLRTDLYANNIISYSDICNQSTLVLS